jgi:hypothetical protein
MFCGLCCIAHDVSHLRRWGVFIAGYPALTRWASLWRAYGATNLRGAAQECYFVAKIAWPRW